MSHILNGKKIVLGITGGVAAYKSVYLLRQLKKAGADVQVIGTENSRRFIGDITWESLSGKQPLFSSWDVPDSGKITHIMLAQEVDAIVVAPSTANILAKAAHGIADDLLSTVLLAATVPVIYAPGMNSAMYEHAATQDNIKILNNRGAFFVDAESGALACNESGKGRMAEPDHIIDKIKNILTEKIFSHTKIVITGGATREYIDPVRYISNGSSGKTGFALAQAAYNAGADVVYIAGKDSYVEDSIFPIKIVETADDMLKAVTKELQDTDVFIMSAAVGDYTCKKNKKKLKKSDKDLEMKLFRTVDILKHSMGLMKNGSLRIGFAAESENLIENARRKLIQKKLDFIVANSVTDDFSPFGNTENKVTFVYKDHTDQTGKIQKTELATLIINKIKNYMDIKND